MSVSTIEQYGNLLADVTLAVTTTPQKVATLLANAGVTLPAGYFGYSLTNNDGTNAAYIGFSSAVAATKYYRNLAISGGLHQGNAGPGVFNKLWIVGAGNANVQLVVFG